MRNPEAGEQRTDYSDADRHDMAKSGEAMPDGSYPIKNTTDLQNAIHAVGRGGADHDAIRKHIIARAHALNAADAIPDNWNSDGSLKQSNSRRWKNRTPAAVPFMPEVRRMQTGALELRDGSSSDQVIVEGYFLRYGDEYPITDRFGTFTERMAPGVAKDVLSNDVRFLVDHDPSRLLARTTSGTLQLSSDGIGDRMRATLDLRDSDARNLLVRLERGDINQMSCAFIVARDEWNDDMDYRTVHQFAELSDVSAVTYPASPTTSLQVANRMAIELMSTESRARVRRLYAELRAGKALSSTHAGMLTDAVGTLHDLMDSAGVPIPGQQVDVDGDGDDDTAQDFSPDITGQNDPGPGIRRNKNFALRAQARRIRRHS